MDETDAQNEQRILANHEALMRYVERILIFLSTITVAVLGFAGLNTSSGLWVVIAFVALFFALGFLFLYSRYQRDISFFRIQNDHKFVGHLQTLSDLVVATLIVLVFGAFAFLVAGLVDQYYAGVIIPASPSVYVIWLIGTFALIGVAGWSFFFLALERYWQDGKLRKFE